MSRNRILIIAAVVVVFIVVAGLLINANRHAGQNRTLNVTVTAGKTMDPPEWKADQNDSVTVNIKSDKDGEVHLHGYDVHFDVKAGQTVSQSFRADKSGTFPIEWEATSADLGQLVVSG